MAIADDFSTQYLGQGVEREDSSNAFQCMDWAFAWCERLGIPHSAIRHLYAYQVYTEATDETRQHFDLVPNTPSGFPPAGALVVWGTGVGVAGHIALAVSGSSSTVLMTSDQNWAFKPYIQLVKHNYNSVIGWLVPKQQATNPSEETMDAQQETDAYEIVLGRPPEGKVPDGRTAMQFIYDARNELGGQRAAQVKQAQDLEAQVKSQQQQIDTLNAANTTLQEQLAAAAKQTPAPPVTPAPVTDNSSSQNNTGAGWLAGLRDALKSFLGFK